MTEKEEKSVEQVLKESKELAKVTLSLDVAESGPWRSPEEVENWVKDHYEMTDQGIGEPAASDCANIRESIRLAAKVDSALIEEAMVRCIFKKTLIFGCSEDEAYRRCQNEFKICQDQRGEKPYESKTLADLDALYNKLNGEIIHFRYNCMDPQTPEQAEKLAREKLRLPKIITITKDSEPKKERVFLDRMPSTYGKSKDEVLEEVRKERSEHG